MNLFDIIAIGKIYGYDDKGLWNDIDIDTRINKDILILEIVKNCGGMTPLVNTWESFKMYSDGFFAKWKYQISKLLDTLEFDYNPIWNKDGTTKYIKNTDRERNEERTDDYTENNDTSGNSTNENTVSAYDSSSYQPHEKDTNNYSDTKDITSNRDSDTRESEGIAESYTEIQQGNIGVTTTQAMIKEEQSLYDFNIFTWIVDRYRNELFLRVY